MNRSAKRSFILAVGIIALSLIAFISMNTQPVYADETTDQITKVSVSSEGSVPWGEKISLSAEYTLKYKATWMTVAVKNISTNETYSLDFDIDKQEYDGETHHGTCIGSKTLVPGAINGSAGLAAGNYRIENVTIGYYTDARHGAVYEFENSQFKVITPFGDAVFDKTYYNETLQESLAGLQEGDLAVIRCEPNWESVGIVVYKSILDAIQGKNITLVFPVNNEDYVYVNGKEILTETRTVVFGKRGGSSGHELISEKDWGAYGNVDETYEIEFTFEEDGRLPGLFNYYFGDVNSLFSDGDDYITSFEKVFDNLTFDYISLGKIRPDEGESITYDGSGLTFKLNQTEVINSGTKKNIHFDVSITGIVDKTYTGNAITQTPTLKDNGATLKEGVDYDIAYENNTNVGLAMIIIKGKGNYGGRYVELFRIKEASGGGSDGSGSGGGGDTPESPSDLAPGDVKDIHASDIATEAADSDSNTLTQGTDFILKDGAVEFLPAYTDTFSGEKTVRIVIGDKYYEITVTGTKTEPAPGEKIDITALTTKVANAVYTGSAIEPAVTFTGSDGVKVKLIKDTDYTVTYADAATEIGPHKLTITGMGSYTGVVEKSYKINPAGKAISRVSKGKKSFTVKWKKASKTEQKNLTGYQIRYSLKKNMKVAKTRTLAKAGATKLEIKKLKAKKAYYIQLRTYKTVDGVKYVSAWSKVKKVKTK